MKHVITTVLFFCAMVTACHTSDEKLDPETMKVVLWDVMKMDELYNQMIIKDSTLRKGKEFIRLYEEVYALHHITKKQFDNTYRYYESHPIEMQALLDSVDTYAAREKFESSAAAAKKK